VHLPLYGIRREENPRFSASNFSPRLTLDLVDLTIIKFRMSSSTFLLTLPLVLFLGLIEEVASAMSFVGSADTVEIDVLDLMFFLKRVNRMRAAGAFSPTTAPTAWKSIYI
jgi:hypothetical protein